jgi:hypothetical protein
MAICLCPGWGLRIVASLPSCLTNVKVQQVARVGLPPSERVQSSERVPLWDQTCILVVRKTLSKHFKMKIRFSNCYIATLGRSVKILSQGALGC